MRRKAWIAIACVAAGLFFSWLGETTSAQALLLLGGAAMLTGIFLGLSLLPYWDAWGLRLPAVPPMFVRPGPGQEWSEVEGAPAAGRKTKAS